MYKAASDSSVFKKVLFSPTNSAKKPTAIQQYKTAELQQINQLVVNYFDNRLIALSQFFKEKVLCDSKVNIFGLRTKQDI